MTDTVKQRRRALTLIELVVALVLASVMLVGLLRIVSMVSKESSQLRREQTDYLAAGALAQRLRDDLINSRGLLVSDDSLTLAGFMGSGNRPATISYRRVVSGDRYALLRQYGNEVDLCWVGFGEFVLEPYELIDAETPLPEMTGGLPPTPAEFRIGVIDDEGQVLLSEVVFHHAQ